MPQFIINLKTLYREMAVADRVILTLVALTFFSFPIGTAPPLILIITAFVVSLVTGRLVGIKRLLTQNWFWPVLLFVALPWVGLMYVPEISDVGMDYARKTHYWLYVPVIALLPSDRRAVSLIVKALMAGLVINALFAFIQFAGFAPAPTPSGIKGYFGFGVIYSALSMYLVAGILMASFYFRQAEKNYVKILNLLLIFLFLFHISIMDGRNGYVTFFILSPMVAMNVIGKFEWKKIALICIVFLTCMSLSPVLKNRVISTITNLKVNKEVILEKPWGKKVLDILPRFYLLRSAIDIFSEHPVLGAGTGGYRYFTGKEGGIPQSHPHNNILYMGASFGITGIFSYLWLCWVMFRQSWRSRREIDGYFCLAILLVIFISGFFNSQIIDSGPALFFALGYGFLNHLGEDGRITTDNGGYDAG